MEDKRKSAAGGAYGTCRGHVAGEARCDGRDPVGGGCPAPDGSGCGVLSPVADGASRALGRLRGVLRDERGQGTTEYAILVGVLVVIAIIAIVAFRGKVQELWDAITGGMDSI